MSRRRSKEPVIDAEIFVGLRGPTPSPGPNEKPWSWSEGPVGPGEEHFKLIHGDKGIPTARGRALEDGTLDLAVTNDPADASAAARVGRGPGRSFRIEFLTKDAAVRKAVVGEIEFILLTEHALGDDRWGYALHHCGTAANLYSKIHWHHVPARRPPGVAS